MKIIFLGSCVFVAFSIYLHTRPSGALELVFLDVGQGDAIWIRTPGGANWLIDAGGVSGKQDMGERVILPELTRRAAVRFEGAILSHPDLDHAGGFRTLLRDLTFQRFYVHPDILRGGDPNADALRAQLRETGVPTIGVSAPIRLALGEVDVDLWSLVRGHKPNDRGLVLAIQYGGCHALFTGDIERLGEAEILEAVGGAALRADLLKIAHHGSKSSTTEAFLKRVSPKWSVISVGSRNSYGHPARSTIERLRRHHVQVLRTDFHGYLKFRFSRDGFARCESFWGDCGVAKCSGSDRPIGLPTDAS